MKKTSSTISILGKFDNYIKNCNSYYKIISCSEKDGCKEQDNCINSKCINNNASFYNNTNEVIDFDQLKNNLCKSLELAPFASCDGIKINNDGNIYLIEFKLASKKLDSKDLRDKIFCSLEIIYHILNIIDRITFSKEKISCIIVYNDKKFDSKSFIENSISKKNLSYEYLLEFELSKMSKLLCKFCALDYFEKYILKHIDILSVDEFDKICKIG